MKCLSVLIFLLIASLLSAQPIDLNGWTRIHSPDNDSLRLIAVNSDNLWGFITEKGSTRIAPYHYAAITGDSLPFSQSFKQKIYRDLPGNKLIHAVDDGYLIFTNNGEFGGGTWFISREGEILQKIDGYKVSHIFWFDNILYALQSDGNAMGGSILEVYKENSWHTKIVYNFTGDEPLITTKADKEILIVCFHSLVKFTKTKKILPVLTPPYWWGEFSPTSIKVYDNDLYIAMRHGVQRIKNYTNRAEYEWFVPVPK